MPAGSSSARRRRGCSTHMRMPYTEALLAAIPKLDSAAAHAAARDRRPPARSDAAAARLLLRAALQVRRRALRGRQAAARRPRKRGRAVRLLASIGLRGGEHDRAAVDRRPHRRIRRRRQDPVGRGPGVSLAVGTRRDAGPGGRIGLRQVHARPRRAAAAAGRPAASVTFDGTELTALGGEAMRLMRRRLQLIFQDPIASLNPRRCIGDIIAEPLVITGVTDRAERDAAGARGAGRGRARSRPRDGPRCRTNSPAASASASASPAR